VRFKTQEHVVDFADVARVVGGVRVLREVTSVAEYLNATLAQGV
jgi:hypothetical protein